MILAQNAGMFPSVYPTASSSGQEPLRVAPAVVQLSSLTAACAPAPCAPAGPDVYHLLALIAGFIAPLRLIAGARQGFMVYFSRVIHGKSDVSNDEPSFVRSLPAAISGAMPKTLEPAIKRCRR